jgi:hypothetical protein
MASDTEEAKRKRREDVAEYVYLRPNEARNEGFHSHYCRMCDEEYECTLEECDLALQTICHNCFYKLEEGDF